MEYQDEYAAQGALQNDKMELDGRTLSVSYAKPRGSGGSGGRGGGRGGGRRGKKMGTNWKGFINILHFLML